MEEQIYQRLYELEDAHWWFRGRRAVIWAMLARADVVPQPRVFDAGCGTGRNLVEFGPLGTAAGADTSDTAVRFCRERGLDGVIESSVEELPYDDGSFDLILATDVLEHVEHDDRGARELRRVVSDRGRLLVTVPAYQWMWSHHDDSHHHMRRYTRPRLRTLLTGAGWEPIVQTYFNTVLLAPIAAMRMLERRRPADNGKTDYEFGSGAMNRALLAPMQGEAALIRRGARFPAGVSIGMVCRPVLTAP